MISTRSSAMYKKNYTGNLFTLIEMLVVISIIAILAAMLAPALRNAIDASRVVQCSNNLRLINTGLWMYVEDSSGWLPQFKNTGGISWRKSLNTYVYPSVSLGSCYADCGPWHCPSDPMITTGSDRHWINSTSYGGNASLSFKRAGQIHKPSDTMLAIDTNLKSGNHTFPRSWGNSYAWIDWRHINESSVMGMLDSHVNIYQRYLDYTEADFDYKQWP